MNEIIDYSTYYKKCTQCPRKCGINRLEGKAGICGETAALRAAFAGLHFGEEPLITVHGGSGTIFLTGCTLRCAFCQNYQISQNGMGAPVDSNTFVKICLALQDAGDRLVLVVLQGHFDEEVRGGRVRKREFRTDERILNRHGAGIGQVNIVPDTDGTAADRRDPVPADGRVERRVVRARGAAVHVGADLVLLLDRTRMGVLDNLHGEGILALLDIIGHVEL